MEITFIDEYGEKSFKLYYQLLNSQLQIGTIHIYLILQDLKNGESKIRNLLENFI